MRQSAFLPKSIAFLADRRAERVCVDPIWDRHDSRRRYVVREQQSFDVAADAHPATDDVLVQAKAFSSERFLQEMIVFVTLVGGDNTRFAHDDAGDCGDRRR